MSECFVTNGTFGSGREKKFYAYKRALAVQIWRGWRASNQGRNEACGHWSQLASRSPAQGMNDGPKRWMPDEEA
jgi:hypothetical protein